MAGPGCTRAAVQRGRTARLASVVTAGLQGAPSAPPWSRAAPIHQRGRCPPQHPAAGQGSSVSRRWSLRAQAGGGAWRWGCTLGPGAPRGLCCPAARIASGPCPRAKTRGGDRVVTSHPPEGRLLTGEMKRAFAFRRGECQEYTEVGRCPRAKPQQLVGCLSDSLSHPPLPDHSISPAVVSKQISGISFHL